MKWNLKLKPISRLFPIFHSKPKPKPAASAVAKLPTNPQANPSLPPKLLAPAAPGSPTRAGVARDGVEAPQPAVLAPRPTPSQLLDSVVNLLRKYLVCDDHHLNTLALWIAHTWSFPNSPTAVYLDIRSPEPHCGKSTCLRLLAMLSADSWLAAGPDPRTVASRLVTEQRRIQPGKMPELHPPTTILLDNHHHTLGRSERQGLLAMLSSGTSATAGYASASSEYCLFGPKAFAGRIPLPRSLADQCIPILLLRKRPSDVVARLTPNAAQSVAGLTRLLRQWADEFSTALTQAGTRPPANVPIKLSLLEQDNAEPLLHIADVIGGSWPDKARSALVGCFENAEPSDSLRMLSDVRAWFFMKEYPDYLLTRDLLDSLLTQENRPWSGWPRNAGRRLGALLHPFGIVSRNLELPSGKVLKGYVLRDLKDAWERYLAPLPYKSVKEMPPSPPIGSGNS